MHYVHIYYLHSVVYFLYLIRADGSSVLPVSKIDGILNNVTFLLSSVKTKTTNLSFPSTRALQKKKKKK